MRKSATRADKILSASRQVKEQYLKDLLQKMNDGEAISKKELEVIAKLETELSSGSGEPFDFIVDVHGVAKFYSVTIRTVQLWVKQGECPKLSHGMYNLMDVQKWWLKNIYSGLGPDTEEIVDLKKEHLRWQIENTKMKAQQTKGSLIPKDEIASMWAARTAEIGSGLYSLSSRLPPLLESKSQQEMSATIKQEIRKLHENYCRTGRFCVSNAKRAEH